MKAKNNDVVKARKEVTISEAEDRAKKEAAMKARFEESMKEYDRRYWIWDKARRHELFKATAERVDARNEELIEQGKRPAYGTNGFADYTDEEFKRYSTPPHPELNELFLSKSFVTHEDLRALKEKMSKSVAKST